MKSTITKMPANSSVLCLISTSILYTECRLLSHVEDTTGRVLGTANDTESGVTPVPQQAQSLKCDESVN